jgi:hypothetical protein
MLLASQMKVATTSAMREFSYFISKQGLMDILSVGGSFSFFFFEEWRFFHLVQ